MKNIPIFFTFDNNYTIPAAVAFFTLLKRAPQSIYYELYVAHSDITTENQKLLQDIVNKRSNASLTFINTENFLVEEWKKGNFDGHNKKNQFTKDTIAKCFAAKCLPHLDKVIYSDVDVVFMDDISELIDIDLSSSYLAGVKNPFLKYITSELSHLSKENYELLKDSYIAGGIWVMNLKKIREDDLENTMLDIIHDSAIVKRWPDQDIINIACRNQVKFLPLNYIAYPYIQDEVKKANFVSHHTKEEIFDSIFNPKIIHYAGPKPWNANPRYSDIWHAIHEYLNLPRTPLFSTSKHKVTLKEKFYYYIATKFKKRLQKKGIEL